MPSFPKPAFAFNYHPDAEINAIRRYRDHQPGRQIPAKKANRLLIATWNIANLGLQKRKPNDYKIIAEIISWFDIVALQEVNDDLSGLRSVLASLPNAYRAIFSDKAGNEERMSFLYDSDKIVQLEKIGEIAIPPKDIKYIRLKGVNRKFNGFDRIPYLGSFMAGGFKFVLVNAHLYFGDDSKKDRDRRSLEAYATARWADLRHRDKHAYIRDIIALGDFNVPKVEAGDPIYNALRQRGLRKPEHSSQIASNLNNDKNYDQLMFFPGQTKQKYTRNNGIFDFDGAVFHQLWQNKTPAQFRSFVRYHISDHRPLWAEFKI
ncbi:MAG: endonuclease/exonuclease/phosphatase family protein [Desulfobacterales bacterium]|nr:MAG: endonuclease/exonuclease/phosphatase family protein [Desulfobacterales bacterium]